MKIITTIMLGFLLTTNALAQDNDFYQDKTLQMLVGYSPGGGYDQYARTLARYISKHIPGNPNVIVRNVPGAGSMVLMNQLANTLPNDGTVIGTVARGLPLTDLVETEQDRQIMRLLFARNEMGRPFVASPNVPEERLAILRNAMEATANDPEFLRDIENQGLNAIFMSGQAITEVIQEAYEYPEEVINAIANVM